MIILVPYMRLLQTYSFLLIVLVSISLTAFTYNPQKINAAIESGNVNTLAGFLAARVDVSIDGKDQLLPKAKAKERLSGFFQKHKPSTFAVIHNGKSGSGLTYTIGTLKTSNGTFRVSYYLKNSSGSFIIQQIIIDKAK